MKKYDSFFLIMILLFSGYSFAEKVATFTEFNKPGAIVVDDRQIIVTEGTTVFLYSTKNYRLEKKFGKKGEGPQEFQTVFDIGLRVKLQPDRILVNSYGKLSYFTRDGEYIKEKRHTVGAGGGELFPMKDGFAAAGFARAENQFFITVEIYDTDIKKIKEIFRMPLPLRGQKYKVLEKAIYMQATTDKIYVAGESGFVIRVFDRSGKELYTIKEDYDNVTFTDRNKKEILDYYKTSPNTRQLYDRIKNSLEFPARFQAIRTFIAADQKLYVQTFLRKDGKTEFYMFDDNGKLLKKVWLPIHIHLPVERYQLFTVHGGKLYQLIENEDREEWELHIEKIE